MKGGGYLARAERYTSLCLKREMDRKRAERVESRSGASDAIRGAVLAAALLRFHAESSRVLIRRNWLLYPLVALSWIWYNMRT